MYTVCANKLLFSLLVAGLLLPLVPVFAQSGGAVPPSAGDATAGTAPATVATSAPVTTPKATSTPRVAVPRAITPAPAAVSAPTSTTPSTTPGADTPSSFLLWVALAAVAVIPFGYLAAQAFKGKDSNQDTKNNPGCFNIKKLLDDKLAELTDLKGQLTNKVQDATREKMREALEGTSSGAVLALVEKAEEEYGKLKKLYEECTVEFEKHAFKGTVIEESLTEPGVLDTLQVLSSRPEADQDTPGSTWHLHTVLIPKKEIQTMQRYLKRDGGWYMHFWKDNEMVVVFRDKMFEIKRDDKSTWKDAVAYGLSVGVPAEQLDFLTG